MKLFKNFKTKKQLKEENIRLRAMMSIPTPIHTVERNIEKVQSSFLVPYEERNMPEEFIKRRIAENMIEYLRPLIEYDFTDDENGGKIYKGKLFVASKK